MEHAPPTVPKRLNPRKKPIQSRSGVTVDAICEATIQVLLSHGLTRLTTTRVAERAGVSVGTLYQYFPNKEALLFAILQRHFEEVAESLECLGMTSGPRPLTDLAEGIADAYVSVKTARPEATEALYRVAGAIDQVRLSVGVCKRMETAVAWVLVTAQDAEFPDPERAAFTLLSALAGVSRGSFGKRASDPEALKRLRDDARLLSSAYLRAAANR